MAPGSAAPVSCAHLCRFAAVRTAEAIQKQNSKGDPKPMTAKRLLCSSVDRAKVLGDQADMTQGAPHAARKQDVESIHQGTDHTGPKCVDRHHPVTRHERDHQQDQHRGGKANEGEEANRRHPQIQDRALRR